MEVHTAQTVCALGVGRQEDDAVCKKYTELICRCRQNKRAAVLNLDVPSLANIIGSLRKEEVRVLHVSPQFISNLKGTWEAMDWVLIHMVTIAG